MSKYDDIIRLSRPVSEKHPRMSMTDRAAQFSPFAALTGYDAAVQETARRTDARIELDEDAKEEIDRRIRELQPGEPVTVTYFRPDDRKAGGAYLTVTTEFLGFDPIARCIRLTVATIPVSDLYGVE